MPTTSTTKAYRCVHAQADKIRTSVTAQYTPGIEPSSSWLRDRNGALLGSGAWSLLGTNRSCLLFGPFHLDPPPGGPPGPDRVTVGWTLDDTPCQLNSLLWECHDHPHSPWKCSCTNGETVTSYAETGDPGGGLSLYFPEGRLLIFSLTNSEWPAEVNDQPIGGRPLDLGQIYCARLEAPLNQEEMHAFLRQPASVLLGYAEFPHLAHGESLRRLVEARDLTAADVPPVVYGHLATDCLEWSEELRTARMLPVGKYTAFKVPHMPSGSAFVMCGGQAESEAAVPEGGPEIEAWLEQIEVNAGSVG